MTDSKDYKDNKEKLKELSEDIKKDKLQDKVEESEVAKAKGKASKEAVIEPESKEELFQAIQTILAEHDHRESEIGPVNPYWGYLAKYRALANP
jgi:hypothetical protein